MPSSPSCRISKRNSAEKRIVDIRTEKMEEALFGALEAADAEMESRYGGRFPLHPARPAHGDGINRRYDGLFAFGAGFSPGFGSNFGPGYSLEFRIVTLDSVPPDFREKFEEEAVEELRKQLAVFLPERRLEIVRDADSWKIVGDLSLS